MGRPRGAWQDDILSIIRKSSGPITAYAVLEELRAINPKSAPTTVYRALAALSKQGHIHRIESLNAYVVCTCSARDHASIMSICDDCGVVEETVAPNVISQLSSTLDKAGFSAQRHVIEVHGLCASCNTEGAAQ